MILNTGRKTDAPLSVKMIIIIIIIIIFNLYKYILYKVLAKFSSRIYNGIIQNKVFVIALWLRLEQVCLVVGVPPRLTSFLIMAARPEDPDIRSDIDSSTVLLWESCVSCGVTVCLLRRQSGQQHSRVIKVFLILIPL